MQRRLLKCYAMSSFTVAKDRSFLADASAYTHAHVWSPKPPFRPRLGSVPFQKERGTIACSESMNKTRTNGRRKSQKGKINVSPLPSSPRFSSSVPDCDEREAHTEVTAFLPLLPPYVQVQRHQRLLLSLRPSDGWMDLRTDCVRDMTLRTPGRECH